MATGGVSDEVRKKREKWDSNFPDGYGQLIIFKKF